MRFLVKLAGAVSLKQPHNQYIRKREAKTDKVKQHRCGQTKEIQGIFIILEVELRRTGHKQTLMLACCCRDRQG